MRLKEKFTDAQPHKGFNILLTVTGVVLNGDTRESLQGVTVAIKGYDLKKRMIGKDVARLRKMRNYNLITILN